MPEETTPPEGNSVENEAAQINWDSPDNPYLKRYTDTQSAYTQNQQRLRELEQYESDRDAYIKLGQKHGVEFEFPEEQQQPTSGDPQTAQELAELRAWKEEVETERQERAYAEGERAVRTQHDEWAKEAGIKLSDFDHDAIIKRALDSGANDIDDVKGIFDAYVEHRKGERDALEAEIREQMKRPRVPTPPPGGSAATGTKAMHELTRQERDDLAYERAASQT